MTAKNGLGLGMRFVVLMLLSGSVLASDLSLEVHFASKHFIEAPQGLGQFNEENYGLGIQYQINDLWHISGGIYQNSFMSHEMQCGTRNGYNACWWESKAQLSNYIAVGRSMLQGDGYEMGVEAGVADGYEGWKSERGFRSNDNVMKTFGDEYMPMIGPYLTLGNQYAVKIRYMPTVLLSAGFQYSF